MSKLSTKQVAEAIYASAKNKTGAELSSALQNAVEFLAKKNLLGKAPEIIRHVKRISDAEHGILRAKVLSKTPLTKTETAKVESLLEKRHKGKGAVLEWKEDKGLLGGIRIETEDEVLDLSLKNKVNQLQNYLLKQ